MKNLTILFLLLSLFFLSGCVMLPHFKTIHTPISGYVITEDSNAPIENAVVKVYYSDNGRRKTKTDESGYFYLPEKKQFGLFRSIIGDDFVEYLRMTLKINAQGFEERKFSIPNFWIIDPFYSKSKKLYDGFIITPEGYIIIPLKKVVESEIK